MSQRLIYLYNWTAHHSRHGGVYLLGSTEEHPRLGRSSVKTSDIVWIDLAKGIAQTQNTLYELKSRGRLGTPDKLDQTSTVPDEELREKYSRKAVMPTHAEDRLEVAPSEIPLITHWAVQLLVPDRTQSAVLIGIVQGHPRLPDGPVVTSNLEWVDLDKGWAATRNRLYRLGKRGSVSDEELRAKFAPPEFIEVDPVVPGEIH